MTKDYIPAKDLRIGYTFLIKTQIRCPLQINHGLSAAHKSHNEH